MKTVGSLCIGDMVYIAYTSEIKEYRVRELSISGQEIKVVCGDSSGSSDEDRPKNIKHPTRSQTAYTGRYGNTVCVNKDKAIRLQYEMRLKAFNERAGELTEKIGSLEAMLLGWFQPDDPEKSKEPEVEE